MFSGNFSFVSVELQQKIWNDKFTQKQFERLRECKDAELENSIIYWF